MNWLKFVGNVVNFIVAMISGYEISEILNDNSNEKQEKQMAAVLNIISKATDQKGITREEMMEIKIVSYAIIAIIMFASVLGIVCAVYFGCKRCATKTVQKALEPSKLIK